MTGVTDLNIENNTKTLKKVPPGQSLAKQKTTWF
jgi:hypothetical protein